MNNNNRYLIYGAGGHAKVLKDLIECFETDAEVFTFFNDGLQPDALADIPVIPYNDVFHLEMPVVLGIGSAKVRKTLAEKVRHSFATLVHPNAYIAKDVEIGEGTVVLAGAVIQTGAKIGKHTIINSNVTIDHDAIVKDYVTTYPGVYVGAEVVIGAGTTINPNAVIMRFSKTVEFSEIEPGEIFNKKDT